MSFTQDVSHLCTPGDFLELALFYVARVGGGFLVFSCPLASFLLIFLFLSPVS